MPDPALPLLFNREQAFAAGLTRHQVAQRVRSERWTTLRRGWYCETDRFDAQDDAAKHLLRLVAALRCRGDTDAASHLSGALVHGWPMPFNGPGPATLTSGDLARSARRRDALVVQVATLPDQDVASRRIDLDGTMHELLVTSPARTVADCLRHLPNEDGVAIADAAVRARATSVEEVRRVLDRQESWPYLANGRRGLELVDARRETYLESYSFVRLAVRGVPCEPQVEVYDESGRFVARVDGWVDEAALVLEADGTGKYLIGAKDPTDAADVARAVRTAMTAQQERERQLRDLGARVVRWGPAEAIHHPDRLAARARAERSRGRRADFRGRVRRTLPPS